jgi:hypothetical protein
VSDSETVTAQTGEAQTPPPSVPQEAATRTGAQGPAGGGGEGTAQTPSGEARRCPSCYALSQVFVLTADGERCPDPWHKQAPSPPGAPAQGGARVKLLTPLEVLQHDLDWMRTVDISPDVWDETNRFLRAATALVGGEASRERWHNEVYPLAMKLASGLQLVPDEPAPSPAKPDLPGGHGPTEALRKQIVEALRELAGPQHEAVVHLSRGYLTALANKLEARGER